ncbi:MAG: V-type ATP synthase subunit A, partial [Spirochaetaceae bacterium]|nr:V-type ATP synthase subunit A [Spirochaetaceae bacterium]
EAFPAYLESVIASFYERAGIVRLKNGKKGSVTIGGTVSPAGGNFEEPVTQATLKVVGSFHGLSRERSDARKYPAIDPLTSWSKYKTSHNEAKVEYGRKLLFKGNDVAQMMKVVGEEGTSIEDYILYLKSDFLDAVYIQQNSFDPVDNAVLLERQKHIFEIIFEILGSNFDLQSKDEARQYFNQLRQLFLDYNGTGWQTDEFKAKEKELRGMLSSKQKSIEETVAAMLEKK